MHNSTVSYVAEQVAAISEIVEQLARTLEARTACISVVGMGYVGLPLGKALCERGFDIIGFDIDQSKVDGLNAGQSYIHQVPDEAIRGFVEGGGRLAVTSDFGSDGRGRCRAHLRADTLDTSPRASIPERKRKL